MKAKVIQDGNRVVITFTGIENPESFVERVAKIISDSSENEIIPQKVEGLIPVTDEKDEESYEEEILDFAAPYTGKAPEEIIKMPQFEGFYFLCRTEIPEQHKEKVNSLLYEFAEKRKFFPPPYGNVERMKKYLEMAEKILGLNFLESVSEEKADELDIKCESAFEKIQKFFESKKV